MSDLLVEHEICLSIHEAVNQERLAAFKDRSAVPIAWHHTAD